MVSPLLYAGFAGRYDVVLKQGQVQVHVLYGVPNVLLALGALLNLLCMYMCTVPPLDLRVPYDGIRS